MQSPFSAAAALAFRNTDQKCLNPHLLADESARDMKGLPGSARKHTLGWRGAQKKPQPVRMSSALPADKAQSPEAHRLRLRFE